MKHKSSQALLELKLSILLDKTLDFQVENSIVVTLSFVWFQMAAILWLG